MPAWSSQYDFFQGTTQTVVTTTETVVATISNVSTPGAGARVKLAGDVDFSAGLNATTVTLRWRRGVDITGAQIGPSDPVNITPGNTVMLHLDATDTPAELALATYVLTVQQAAATANGSVFRASGRVTV